MTKFVYTTSLRKIRRLDNLNILTGNYKRIKVIQGGTSSSKTFSIIAILIDKAIKKKGVSISIVSESMPHLRKGAMRDFLNIMKMTGRYMDSHWNRTNSVYTFSNGSYIEFFGADSPDKLRGARRNILFINECNNIHKEAYEQLAMRTDGDIYLDYNPSHQFWVDDVLKSDDSVKLILTYKDNEALSQSIIDYLESKRELAKTSEYWTNWCRVYLDGLQGRLEGVIFENYEIIDSIPEDARMIACGLDFGYTNDPTALTAVYKYNDSIILDELIYEKGLLNSHIAKKIKSFDIDVEVIADSAEPKSIKEISNYGIRITGAKKGRDSIINGISILQEQKILITKRSYNVIGEFEKYGWKTDRNGNVLNIPMDDYNHAIDGIRYVALAKLSNSVGRSPSIVII